MTIGFHAVPTMTLQSVLGLIEQARRQESHVGRFRSQMAEKLKELHLVIEIDHVDPVSCLVRFVEEYVEMAPRLVECVERSARLIGQAKLFSPFLAAAVEAFEQPSALLARFDGLDALLIKAYLCHRLLEEMYENNRSIRNANLVDAQTTQANLLAHHLIGEPFANELDSSVLATVHQLMKSPDYFELNLASFVREIRQAGSSGIQDHWQNLLLRNQISFNFSYRDPLQ